MSGTPRIAVFDIETLPPSVYTWSLYKPVIGINQIIEPGRIAGVGWKWRDEKRVKWLSEFDLGHEEMVRQLHALMDEADIIVGWNSISFDERHLQAEFKQYGLAPPSPCQQVDLMRVAKSRFRLLSYKLDFVAQWLGVGAKMKHAGFSMWIDCIKGDPKAWNIMGRYCKQDVLITDLVYDEMLPYIKTHPHMGLYSGESECCSNCGSADIQWRGVSRTVGGTFARFQCKQCGKWGKSTKTIERVTTRGVA